MPRALNLAFQCSEKYIEPYYQPAVDMCQPTCLKVTLDALARQYNISKLKMSLKTIAKLCEYKSGLGCPSDAVIDNINRGLEKHKFMAKREVAPRSDITLLKEILRICSFPIVALSAKYFDDYKTKTYEIQGQVDYEHTVVVIEINEKDSLVYFFDPWEKYAEKKLSSDKTPPNNLIIPKFIKLWEGANRWTMWVQPLKLPTEKVKGQKKIEEWVRNGE